MSTRIVVLVFAITLGASHVGFGQETTGTISGRVVDSQGLPIPGATVMATGPQGTKPAVTDGTGNFTVPFLTPGTYAVRIELQGLEGNGEQLLPHPHDSAEGEDGIGDAPLLQVEHDLLDLAEALASTVDDAIANYGGGREDVGMGLYGGIGHAIS